MNRNTHIPLKFLLVGLVLLFLSSCGSEPDKVEGRTQRSQEKIVEDTAEELDVTAKMLAAKYLQQFTEQFLPLCPNVCQRVHHRLTAASRDSFFVDMDERNYERMSPDIIHIPWAHFRGRVMGNYPNEGRERGVVFCFGLDSKFEFKLGINVVLLKPEQTNVWSFDSLEKATMYVVENGKMEPISRTNWKRDYGDRYKGRVRILQSDGEYRALAHCDHLEYIMPWESEMILLGEHNPDVAMSTDIVFSLAAERIACTSDTTNVELRQFVMGHLRGYLTNEPSDPHKQFFRRATDLGTPCPPRCGKFVAYAPQNCARPDYCE